ncbi:LPXTG cell wall anchor domain-containing protein [Saccharothrix syringae]|uniref:LPXTG cell wall anchor domain-containing protein n=2 Tax=Saccharothrix syringae TaxID=103733 RepID=A0A5Q0HDK1_SACSY|nr:LPXTG cell wall anchor domain-containing protein [Saccharothrix syringae]
MASLVLGASLVGVPAASAATDEAAPRVTTAVTAQDDNNDNDDSSSGNWGLLGLLGLLGLAGLAGRKRNQVTDHRTAGR